VADSRKMEVSAEPMRGEASLQQTQWCVLVRRKLKMDSETKTDGKAGKELILLWMAEDF